MADIKIVCNGAKETLLCNGSPVINGEGKGEVVEVGKNKLMRYVVHGIHEPGSFFQTGITGEETVYYENIPTIQQPEKEIPITQEPKPIRNVENGR